MSKGRIDDVEILSKDSLTSSKYIKPMRVKYKQAGREKLWDYTDSHDSVAVLIFNSSIQSFILVKQFRPAAYMSDLTRAEKNNSPEKVSPANGIMLEICAGLVDRDDEPINIAASEVLEETGYKVSTDQLELICKFRTAVGISGALQWLYYTEVDDSMKVTDGGGSAVEGELIDLHYLKLEDVESFAYGKDCSQVTSGALFALAWFLRHKSKKWIVPTTQSSN